jgi:hypothetical protein
MAGILFWNLRARQEADRTARETAICETLTQLVDACLPEITDSIGDPGRLNRRPETHPINGPYSRLKLTHAPVVAKRLRQQFTWAIFEHGRDNHF